MELLITSHLPRIGPCLTCPLAPPLRESIKFIKASSAREEKFAEIALQLEIPSTKTLCLDVTTQWNTTYLMLLAALDYKQAFTTLETCVDNYNEAPSGEDWKKVEAACTYLKLLYDSVALRIASWHQQTQLQTFSSMKPGNFS